MHIFLIAVFAVILSNSSLAFPVENQQKLWDVPTSEVSYEVIDSYVQGSIQVQEINYYSRNYLGQPSKIFGYYCYPTKSEGKLPAILISHGGGGTAVLANTIVWARRGYAVLAIDLPGKGEQRAGSRSTGPNMDVPTLLTVEPLENNYLIHAVAATRNGITFLTMQKEVDVERIGMVGLSWGGVLTLLTNGQDTRLKTAVNVFGAGFIPELSTWQERFDDMSSEELALWNKNIDPKNFLASQHAPILFITGTNDHCYYLPIFQKTYDQITVDKQLYLVPNLQHKFLPDTQNVVFRWLDDKLKYNANFPNIFFLSLFKKGEEKLVVSVKATAEKELEDATLYYTIGSPSRWTKRVWQAKVSYYEDGAFYFGLPTGMIEPEMLFFVNVEDISGRISSTPIRSILKVHTIKDQETYAVSEPIKQINVHEPPLKLLGAKEPEVPEFLKIFFSKTLNQYHAVEANAD
ncbi:MAG: acetylxylan esterase [bacterium]